jgi:hypothetical protein
VAVRKRLYHPDEVREKIKTSQFINRLTSFINGDIDLSPHQVTAALGLIKKTLPDLQAIESTLKGDKENPIVVSNVDSEL